MPKTDCVVCGYYAKNCLIIFWDRTVKSYIYLILVDSSETVWSVLQQSYIKFDIELMQSSQMSDNQKYIFRMSVKTNKEWCHSSVLTYNTLHVYTGSNIPCGVTSVKFYKSYLTIDFWSRILTLTHRRFMLKIFS